MSCGGRVYKGDTVTISVPFDVDDYSNLTITYSTIGDEKIVLTEDEVEIEDGFITHTFQGHDLDLLPDGVIYYTIECDVLGVPNVDSTNTNLYLKTPAGYSGKTADEIYQEGYEAGLEDCSGSSCNLQSKSVVVTADTQSVTPDQGYDGMDSVFIDANTYAQEMFDRGYDSGYEDAEEEYPRLQYQKNYTAITKTDTIYPDRGYEAMKRVNIDATPLFNQAFQSGFTAGQASCPECPTNIQGTAQRVMTQEGETFYPDEGYDGMGSVYVDGSGLYQSAYTEGYQAGLEDCSGGTPCDCSSTVTESYQSGYTDGYNQGIQACQDLWGGIWCADENWDGQEITLTPADFASTGAGFSSITISDCGYGQSKYNEGFADGQESCPECSGTSCNLVPGQFELYVGWSGSETINPPASADGFSSFTIVDNGYYGQAYDAGFEDGYQTGIMETDCSSAITESYNSGFSSGRTVGRREGYYQGEQSVIHSFLAGNDIGINGGYYQYGTLVAHYYTPSGQPCVITGYNDDCNIRWDDVFQSMSVDGGPLQSPKLYYYFTAGWHQIRFTIKDRYLEYAFSHNFQPTQVEVNGNMVYPYMDALKAVSLPGPTEYGESGVTAFIGTFYMNNGIRILSSSIGSSDIGNANIISGAPNLNIIISHYEGNDNVDIRSDVQNGILFYPAGKSSTHSSTLTGWTHMELF